MWQLFFDIVSKLHFESNQTLKVLIYILSHTFIYHIIVFTLTSVKDFINSMISIYNMWTDLTKMTRFNTSRLRQNGHHFPDIFKRIFWNEDVWILIKISLKFVPKGPINNIPALVQKMAWRHPGAKPLSEPKMIFINLLMHICVTWLQWIMMDSSPCTSYCYRMTWWCHMVT